MQHLYRKYRACTELPLLPPVLLLLLLVFGLFTEPVLEAGDEVIVPGVLLEVILLPVSLFTL